MPLKKTECYIILIVAFLGWLFAGVQMGINGIEEGLVVAADDFNARKIGLRPQDLAVINPLVFGLRRVKGRIGRQPRCGITGTRFVGLVEEQIPTAIERYIR